MFKQTEFGVIGVQANVTKDGKEVWAAANGLSFCS